MTLIWRAAFAVTLAAVTWLSLAPAGALPPVALWDKLAHALAFAALAALARAGWPAAAVAVQAAALLSFGLAIEVLQLAVPGREFSWLDLLADGCGIAAGAVIACALLPHAVCRAQHRVAKGSALP